MTISCKLPAIVIGIDAVMESVCSLECVLIELAAFESFVRPHMVRHGS